MGRTEALPLLEGSHLHGLLEGSHVFVWDGLLRPVVVQVVLLVDVLQAGQHRVVADGAELVGEGAVEDQDVHGEHPLADGRRVLQHEALVDEERAAWEGSGVKEARQKGPDRARPR